MEVEDIISISYIVIILLVIFLIWYYDVFSAFNMFKDLTGANVGKNATDAVVELTKGLAEGAVNEIKKIIPPAKHLGESCTLNTDCSGYTPGKESLGCDNGKCQHMKRDWAGVWYNASECVDKPGGYRGSCNRGFSWPRLENQECQLNEDCAGFKPGQDSLACDNGSCKKQKRDWAGVWYKPSECRDGPARAPGTCNRGFSWPRNKGQECILNEDCAGFKPGQDSLGCNRGTCEPMKRDWAGVWYNAYECRGGIFKDAGTC